MIVDQTGMAQIASTNATTAIDDEVVSFATINTSAGSTFFIQPDFFTNHGDINANQSAPRSTSSRPVVYEFRTVAVSGGQTAQIENGFFSGTQPEGVTNEAGGVISVNGIGSSLSIDSSAFDNSGVVEATNGALADRGYRQQFRHRRARGERRHDYRSGSRHRRWNLDNQQ